MLSSTTTGRRKRKRTNVEMESRSDRRGIRSREGGRKITPIVGKENYRIYRMQVRDGDNTEWTRYVAGSGKRKYLDSYVHRFGREVGFLSATSSLSNIQNDARLAAAQQVMNKVTYNPKSTVARASAQSYLECFVLKMHPNTEYSKFIQKIKDCKPEDAGKIRLMIPSEEILYAWIIHMRDDKDSLVREPNNKGIDGRMNKGTSIKSYLNRISGTLLEFGGARLQRSGRMQNVIQQWTNTDKASRAEAFRLEHILPKLWDIIWKMNWTHEKKVAIWARFLVQVATISRASDVTEYCPTLRECGFPTNPLIQTEDGLPLWISLVWHDWKGRPEKYQKAAYTIRLHMNPQDFRFDPIHWLVQHWALRGTMDENEPILSKLTATSYQNSLVTIFDQLDVKISCTSHSIRRSATMWAARCGANFAVIRNVGRWESLKHMLTYLSEGNLLAQQQKKDFGRDPILDFWVFNPDTEVSGMDTTEHQLWAMQAMHM